MAYLQPRFTPERVDFVRNGSSKAEASRVYEVSIWCIYDWCKRKELAPKQLPTRTNRKLNGEKYQTVSLSVTQICIAVY